MFKRTRRKFDDAEYHPYAKRRKAALAEPPSSSPPSHDDIGEDYSDSSPRNSSPEHSPSHKLSRASSIASDSMPEGEENGNSPSTTLSKNAPKRQSSRLSFSGPNPPSLLKPPTQLPAADLHARGEEETQTKPRSISPPARVDPYTQSISASDSLPEVEKHTPQPPPMTPRDTSSRTLDLPGIHLPDLGSSPLCGRGNNRLQHSGQVTTGAEGQPEAQFVPDPCDEKKEAEDSGTAGCLDEITQEGPEQKGDESRSFDAEP